MHGNKITFRFKEKLGMLRLVLKNPEKPKNFSKKNNYFHSLKTISPLAMSEKFEVGNLMEITDEC